MEEKVKRNKISAEELFQIFSEMFPEWAEDVFGYQKIGSRAIVIFYDENGEDNLKFLYYNDNNWNLGTKMWRKKPNPKSKKDGGKNKNE